MRRQFDINPCLIVLVLAASASPAVIAATEEAPAVPNRILVKFRRDASVLNIPSPRTFGDALHRTLSVDQLGTLSEGSWLNGQTMSVRFATGLSPAEAAREVELSDEVEWAQPDYILSIFPAAQQDDDAPTWTSPVSLAMNAIEIMNSRFRPIPPTPPAPVPGRSYTPPPTRPAPPPTWPAPPANNNGGISNRDPDYVRAPPLPSQPVVDPMNEQAWGLSKISAAAAWSLQKGSTKIVVADIDTGVDYTHPDLVNNLWINPSPDPVLKDIVGYNFAHNDPKPYDDHGHGTHTSGTIGATGFNGVGLSGVSPRVAIMGLKFIRKEGQGTTSDAIRSIDYAVKNGSRVLSNSWGGRSSDGIENRALEEAIQRAAEKDVLFVAAAGNDGTDNDKDPVYPASFRLPNILTVASTTDQDGRSFFSNFGKETVHVGAPGSGILSTVPGRGYQKNSGTSMACPHVAGLAALILAERPDLTAVQVKKIIMETADRIPALQGITVSGGRINAVAALRRARTIVGVRR